MGTDLVTFKEGASLVISSIDLFIRRYRQDRAVVRHEVAELQVRLDAALAAQRVRSVGDVGRANIAEIARTFDTFKSEPPGPAYDLMLDQMEHLSRQLKGILDGMAP